MCAVVVVVCYTASSMEAFTLEELCEMIPIFNTGPCQLISCVALCNCERLERLGLLTALTQTQTSNAPGPCNCKENTAWPRCLSSLVGHWPARKIGQNGQNRHETHQKRGTVDGSGSARSLAPSDRARRVSAVNHCCWDF